MSETTVVEPGDEILPGNPPMVHRYRVFPRINHWVSAIAMVLLVLSGLAMFHPSLFFLSDIFGGGQNTRALHPWFGIVLFLSFLVLFLQFWRTNLWIREDTAWSVRIPDLLRGHEEKMPEIGKNNAGQKLVFWSMALLILGLFSSGIAIWDQYFSHLTSIETQRLALWAHSILAIFAICVLIVHVASAIWVRGSFDAMITGVVPVGWAYRHHRKWFRQLVARSEQGRSGKQ